MKKSKNQLKTRFTTGSKPTQDDFADWLDSFVHLDSQQAVDAQVVSQLLIAYDQTLKSQNQDGTVNTLGDVFAMFAGLDDAVKLKDIFAKISWSALPGKPSTVDLQWTEQTIATDISTYNPLASAGSGGAGPATRWLVSGVGGLLTNGAVLIDIKTERHWITSGAGGEGGFYLDQIVAVKVGAAPKAKLS